MSIRTLVCAALLGGALYSQSNQLPGTDAALATTDSLASFGRSGSENGLACGVTVCNVGTVDIHWKAAMDARHPVYAPILCRETNGRFLQISDWSWVKHGFSSINANACNTCNTTDSTILGPNCSDTYGAGLNANRYYLGPPSEIDPWLATWSPVGSYFDRGDPDVGLPRNRDGQRSLTNSMANALPPTAHLIRVDDADLAVPGSRFWYGQYIVINGEPEANRANNAVVREVRPVASGGGWSFTDLSGDRQGNLLLNWQGASVSSAANGNDDGRFYVGVKVTGPNAQGIWHYEYAVHNRDSARGGASFRINKCPSVTITNAGSHDIDRNPATDWTVSVSANEVAFFATPSQAQEWNTVHSFWFDANGGPSTGTAQIDLARPGPGALTLSMSTEVPGPSFMHDLGAGCGSPLPILAAYGTPARPTIPNPSFGIYLSNAPGSVPGVLLASFATGHLALGNGCALFLDPGSTFTVASFTTLSWGIALVPTPIPSQPSLDGTALSFQGVFLVPGGPLFGAGSMSGGVEFILGSSSVCR